MLKNVYLPIFARKQKKFSGQLFFGKNNFSKNFPKIFQKFCKNLTYASFSNSKIMSVMSIPALGKVGLEFKIARYAGYASACDNFLQPARKLSQVLVSLVLQVFTSCHKWTCRLA